MIRNSLHGMLLATLVVALVNCGSDLFASPPASTPEISPAAASRALAVLTGSGLMLVERLRFRRK